MWPFGKSKSGTPELNDEAMEGLALMLMECPDDPTSGVELLQADQFDYTVQSLGAMDQFLEKIRTQMPDGQELAKFVLRCGAYVGEVIRRNAKKEWHWLDFDQAVLVSKQIKSFGRNLGCACVLWDTKSGFVFRESDEVP